MNIIDLPNDIVDYIIYNHGGVELCNTCAIYREKYVNKRNEIINELDGKIFDNNGTLTNNKKLYEIIEKGDIGHVKILIKIISNNIGSLIINKNITNNIFDNITESIIEIILEKKIQSIIMSIIPTGNFEKIDTIHDILNIPYHIIAIIFNITNNEQSNFHIMYEYFGNKIKQNKKNMCIPLIISKLFSNIKNINKKTIKLNIYEFVRIFTQTYIPTIEEHTVKSIMDAINYESNLIKPSCKYNIIDYYKDIYFLGFL